MDEYIKKADALAASKITYIECLYDDEDGYSEGECDVIPVVFRRDIEAIPAADVVPVVRCKDCVYSWDRDGDGRLFCREFERSPSFFCADGQRRDFQEKSK